MKVRAAAFLLTLAVALTAHGRGVPGRWPWLVVVSEKGAFFGQQLCGTLSWTDGSRVSALDFGNLICERPVVIDGWVYALAGDYDGHRLHRTDGAHPPEVVRSFDGQLAWGLTATSSRIFFFTRSAAFADLIRLWASDGTPEGTKIVRTFATDETRTLVAMDDRVLFSIYAAEKFEYRRTAYELWSSDGTTAGTNVVMKKVIPTFVPFRDVALYHQDGVLWRTDGTAAGTFALGKSWKLINTSRDLAWFMDDRRVVQTDGTVAGTVEIASLDFVPTAMVNLGTRTVALERDSRNVELHLIESGRSRALFSIEVFDSYTDVTYRQIGSVLFFRTRTKASRDQVWRTDGTAEGTYIVSSLPISSNVPPLYDLNGRLLFWAYDGVHGFEPWISDGLPNDARMAVETMPEGTIRGRVTDAVTGEPVAEAVIDVLVGAWGNLHVIGSEPVGQDGRYVFEGALGQKLTVRARGTAIHLSASWPQPLDVEPHDVIDGIDIALPVGGRIAGRVVDPDGKPLAGATVRVLSYLRAMAPLLTTTTTADGSYITNGLLPDSEVFVVATHPDYSGIVYDGASCAAGCEAAASATPVRVRTGEVRGGIDFALRTQGKVKGRVLDAVTGEPVMAPFRVNAWRTGRNPANVPTDISAATNASGEYELTLADGSYWVAAYPPFDAGYSRVWYPNFNCPNCTAPARAFEPVAGTTITHDFHTQPLGARLIVKVVDAGTGAPLAGIRLTITNYSSREHGGTTNAEGVFVTKPHLPPGTVHVVAEPSATHLGTLWDGASGRTCRPCNPQDGARIAVNGTDVHRIEMRVERGAVLHGRVFDAATGAPVRADIQFGDKRASSDGGRFTLTGLYPGEQHLIARHPNFETATIPVTVARGATHDVEVPLRANCRNTLEPPDASMPGEGGQGSFEVLGGCAWSLLGATYGISAERRGNAVAYRVAPNPFPIERTLQVFIEGVAFTVRQSEGFRRD